MKRVLGGLVVVLVGVAGMAVVNCGSSGKGGTGGSDGAAPGDTAGAAGSTAPSREPWIDAGSDALSSDGETDAAGLGTGGSAGTTGGADASAADAAGAAGAAGALGGAGGSAGDGGSAGTGGAAGDAGTGGSAGAAGGGGGTAGTAGTAGTGGAAGTGGVAGAAGGAGTAGTAGTPGAGGAAGTGGVAGATGGAGTAGTAGAAGVGGAGGTGGSGTVGCGSPLIIDDMEDGNGAICPNSVRQGGWYALKGIKGTISPTPDTVVMATAIPGGRSGSQYGMHTSGSGFVTTNNAENWAVLGVSVNDKQLYDATVHSGLTFWARSPGGPLHLRVNLTTTTTRAVSEGGTCVQQGTLECHDHWGKWIDLTTEWQQYSINFGYISQAGWGQVKPKDLAHLWTIEFNYLPAPYNAASPNPTSFDYWIDDVAFW